MAKPQKQSNEYSKLILRVEAPKVEYKIVEAKFEGQRLECCVNNSKAKIKGRSPKG